MQLEDILKNKQKNDMNISERFLSLFMVLLNLLFLSVVLTLFLGIMSIISEIIYIFFDWAYNGLFKLPWIIKLALNIVFGIYVMTKYNKNWEKVFRELLYETFHGSKNNKLKEEK